MSLDPLARASSLLLIVTVTCTTLLPAACGTETEADAAGGTEELALQRDEVIAEGEGEGCGGGSCGEGEGEPQVEPVGECTESVLDWKKIDRIGARGDDDDGQLGIFFNIDSFMPDMTSLTLKPEAEETEVNLPLGVTGTRLDYLRAWDPSRPFGERLFDRIGERIIKDKYLMDYAVAVEDGSASTLSCFDELDVEGRLIKACRGAVTAVLKEEFLGARRTQSSELNSSVQSFFESLSVTASTGWAEVEFDVSSGSVRKARVTGFPDETTLSISARATVCELWGAPLEVCAEFTNIGCMNADQDMEGRIMLTWGIRF